MKRLVTIARLSLACLSLGVATQAHAGGITLGSAVNYAVLGIGQITYQVGHNNITVGSSAQSVLQSKMTINGNEGISQGGTLTVNNTSSNAINGNVYEYSSGQASIGGSAVFTGSIITSSSTLATNDSDVATALSVIASLTATDTINGNITTNTTITGDGGVNVIQVNGNIVTSTGNSLTLTGTASDYFIVRVTGDADVQGATNTGLLVGGGVSINHVIYDFTGTANELGGSVADCASNGGFQVCTGKNTTIDGTLLAPNLMMVLDNNSFGEAIGGQEIVLQSGGSLSGGPGYAFVGVPSPEPATLLLLGSGVCAAMGMLRRRRRA